MTLHLGQIGLTVELLLAFLIDNLHPHFMNLVKYLSAIRHFHALEDAVEIVWTLTTVVIHSWSLQSLIITTTTIIILIVARV